MKYNLSGRYTLIKYYKNHSSKLQPEALLKEQGLLKAKKVPKWIWLAPLVALIIMFLIDHYVFHDPLHYLRNQVLTDSSLIDGATVNYKRTEYWTGTMRVSLKLPSGAAEELIKDNILKSCSFGNNGNNICSNPTWKKVNNSTWQTWSVIKDEDTRESIVIYIDRDELVYQSVEWYHEGAPKGIL